MAQPMQISTASFVQEPQVVSTATFPQSQPQQASSTAVFYPTQEQQPQQQPQQQQQPRQQARRQRVRQRQQPSETINPLTQMGQVYTLKPEHLQQQQLQQQQQRSGVPTHMKRSVMQQQQRNVHDPGAASDAPLPPSIAHLPTHIIQQYRRRFDAIDLNKDGEITLREMAAVGKVFGYRLSLTELAEIFGKRDLDDSGAITFDEFVVAMINRQKKNKELEPLRQHFARYDYLRKGYITSDEAYPILRKELGFDLNKTESLIDMFDKNRDYRLSIYEFKEFYNKVEALKAEVRTAFDDFDKDHDGYVNFEEAAVIMKPRGFTDEEVLHFFHKYDEDGDGRLNYSEFARFWDVPLF